MRKKKPLIVGIAIGALARPVIKRAYKPFSNTVRKKLYNLALDFINKVDNS